MRLDLSKLEKVREVGRGILQARCPACAEGGNDRTGEHLRIYQDGRFGCCVYPKNHEHRQRIFALAGDRTLRQFTVKVPNSPPPVQPPQSISESLTALLRTLRTPSLEANPKTGAAERELRTLRTGFSMSRGNSERGVAGVNEHPISGKDSKNGVLSVLGRSKEAPEPQAFPFLSPGGTLVIPFNSPERYHWWKPDGNRMSVKDIINELRLRQKPITKGTSPVEQITLQQNVNPQSSQQKVMSNLQLSLPKVTSNVHFSSASNEWDTPPDFYDKLHKEFGFTLDPCCTHENAKCPKHFTQAENGLTQDWSGERVFMNPPYGREIGQWMKKAWEESRRGALVVCLVPARTDTAWWHNYAIKGTEIRYIRGRLKFGGAANSAPFPSAVVIFNPCT